MSRLSLPDRRAHEAIEFDFRGRSYSVGVGRFSNGRLAEIFLDAAKVANDAADDARDIAVLVSIALQHGTPVDAMRGAVTRLDDGSPAGLAGRVLDLLSPDTRPRRAAGLLIYEGAEHV